MTDGKARPKSWVEEQKRMQGELSGVDSQLQLLAGRKRSLDAGREKARKKLEDALAYQQAAHDLRIAHIETSTVLRESEKTGKPPSLFFFRKLARALNKVAELKHPISKTADFKKAQTGVLELASGKPLSKRHMVIDRLIKELGPEMVAGSDKKFEEFESSLKELSTNAPEAGRKLTEIKEFRRKEWAAASSREGVQKAVEGGEHVRNFQGKEVHRVTMKMDDVRALLLPEKKLAERLAEGYSEYLDRLFSEELGLLNEKEIALSARKAQLLKHVEKLAPKVGRELSRPARVAAGKEREWQAADKQEGIRAETRLLRRAGFTDRDLHNLRSLSYAFRGEPELAGFEHDFDPRAEIRSFPEKVAEFAHALQLVARRKRAEGNLVVVEPPKPHKSEMRRPITEAAREKDDALWVRERIVRNALSRASLKHAVPYEWLLNGIPPEKRASAEAEIRALNAEGIFQHELGKSGRQYKIGRSSVPYVKRFLGIEGELTKGGWVASRPRELPAEVVRRQTQKGERFELHPRHEQTLAKAASLHGLREYSLGGKAFPPRPERKLQRLGFRKPRPYRRPAGAR